VIELLQRTLDGAFDGAAYALAGLGLTLTFGMLRRLNLAYGAGAMLAVYVGAWLHQRFGLSLFVIAPVVVCTSAAIGVYVEWLCFAKGRDETSRGATPVAGADGREVVALAASFAIWMQLEQLAVNLLPRHLNPFPSLAAHGEWSIGALQVRPDRLALALVAVAMCLGFAQWLRKSRTGLAWRAASDQRTAAALSGIAVARVQRIAFAAASALAGCAAFALASIDGQVTPMLGMWLLIKGLVAAMLGGLGSITGVLIGGLVLGVTEAHAQALTGALGREFAAYALLFAALVVPWRRFGLRVDVAGRGLV
jgi:branched-chain amino acid transport system permease protein